ncbi:protein kinase domain-containing protein [Ditylenchus destructor]|uniref:non-specific serine/threonine protein kinase n=1 Tax=Ditylenchus destructor TaxID=166010 RepID=A0AAD4N222_9BILA|nr:protein kinase domain-containing protein [Ditylenchus destructor]
MAEVAVRKVPLTVKTPPSIKAGFLIKDILMIERLIGKGGFGHIYQARDIRYEDIAIAVKVALRSVSPARMVLEQRVLLVLSNTSHSPEFLGCGNFGEFMYIAMELLGENLTDIRKKLPQDHFSVSTTLRVALQCFDALKAVHEAGFLHRDVKPTNICIGFGPEECRKIFLIDFGMVRRFRQPDGKLRRPRSYVGFRGTTRFASISVHKRKDQSPSDDMWSLLYSLIELGEGSLPWRRIGEHADVLQQKENNPIESLCKLLPKDLKLLSDHLATLAFGQVPNYRHLKLIVQRLLKTDSHVDESYDWEKLENHEGSQEKS